jgi:hypothetical protein
MDFKRHLSGKKAVVVLSAIILSGALLALNMETGIRQGVNFEVHDVRMPLYVKLLDFWTRHKHYGLLTKQIVGDAEKDGDKLLRLFEWTTKNIRPVPAGFPVIDDHVDNIIIRGYGTDDQSADVFSTLAAYAGFNSVMKALTPDVCNCRYTVSFVESNGRILVFDTFSHFYFVNSGGEIASVDDIKRNPGMIRKTVGDYRLYGKYDYFRIYEGITAPKKTKWTRADMQMPAKRLAYMVGIRLRLIRPEDYL